MGRSDFSADGPAGPDPGAQESDRKTTRDLVGPSRQCRVLVVDDNEDIRDSLSILLSLMGHDIQTAHDASTALALSESFRPEVILMDVSLGQDDGYEVGAEIRGQPWGASVLLVAMTGWTRDDEPSRVARAGFDAHILKPADLGTLRALIGRVHTADGGRHD